MGKMQDRWDKFHTDAEGYPKQTVPRHIVRGAKDYAGLPARAVRAGIAKIKNKGRDDD